MRGKQLLVGGLILLGAAAACRIAQRSYEDEAELFEPHRHAVALPHALALQRVSLRARDGTRLAGSYLPAKNRAAVVLAHGSGGDRSSLVNEAALLAAHGFGVLLFDWPGHGESEGRVHWNAGERAALRGALDFLAARPELDASRLGVFGFSMGGYIAAQLADDSRIRALALAGTPGDPIEQTRWEYRRYGPLSEWPALLADSRGGLPLHAFSPRQRIAAYAPRPVLIIAGSADPSVPEFMARELYAAARPPKQLLIVPGARHGDYFAAAPALYGQRLREFFSAGLLAAPSGGR